VATARPGSLGKTQAFHISPFFVVNGEAVSNEIISYGLFEANLTEAFLNLLKPGQVTVDVGMHLGYYATLFATLVGSEGEVHAFEPTPSTRQIAEENTRRFPQITVHPFAVWSSNGFVQLRDYGSQWMAFNTLAKAKLEQEPCVPITLEVQTTTLDDFRQRLGRPVSVVKIDAESAEREILKGAERLLASDQPIISVEVGDEGDSRDSRRLADDLLALNYKPWDFRNGQFLRHRLKEVYSYDNLIWAPLSQDLSRGCA
jgi:FkbM family methyltransferase